ncbi:MAG: hypothetical protein KBG48_29435 [Kofleriaceae bacterium]|jgi:hypothetical protein|nr:hypothetical protein [Kofleriaceae bacterium]MBP9171550.1 hypothetical protein [Kofleriaceae bacterium]MBP9860197.1 hypothetical protein [Kofleriaceae bacterium]
MRGDIVLHGFVLTAEEWAAMDPVARSQLLRAALRRDEPWLATSAPPLATDDAGVDERAEVGEPSHLAISAA